MIKKFTIQPKTLATIEGKLNIPAYQRPYCWEKEQIEKLLNDFKENIYNDNYYIGNIITIKTNDTIDLIDGQQRMTTLWILCLYLSEYRSEFLNFCKLGETSRLNFAIRKQTNYYLEALLKVNKNESFDFWNIPKYLPENENLVSDPSIYQNQNIANAFNVMKNWFFDSYPNEDIEVIEKFSDFVFSKVRFQFLTAPQNTDENNLFIQINTNGTQFQHSDILKAELLNCIPDDEKSAYANEWDHIALPYYKSSYNNLKNNYELQTQESFDLVELIDQAEKRPYFEEKDHKIELKNYRYQYIIDFNTLLIHTLFIYCKKYQKELPTEFNTEKLLEIFEVLRSSIHQNNNDRTSEAKKFIDMLKVVKGKIDHHIIFKDTEEDVFNFIPKDFKSYDQDVDIEKSEEKISVDRSTFAQLQRMLYHSNNDNKFYWIGIFLNEYIDSKKTITVEKLEKIENIISLKGRNFETYNSYFRGKIDLTEQISSKEIPLCTFFFGKINRYWFYKLEYVLWKENKLTDKQIISRTSVEHILPQKDRECFAEEEINIDDFGNLILISVSENSGFSSKNLYDKNEYRKFRLSNPPLKMNKLYDDLDNNNLIKVDHTKEELQKLKNVIDKHKTEMVKKIEDHYKF